MNVCNVFNKKNFITCHSSCPLQSILYKKDNLRKKGLSRISVFIPPISSIF